MIECMMRPHVDRHFAGTIAPADERAMRGHLPACPSCSRHYRRRLVLARLDPEAMPAAERLARGLGLGRRAPLLSRAAVSLGLAAAVLLLVVGRRSLVGLGEDAGFVARGGSGVHAEPASRVLVYDVAPGASPALAGNAIRRGDELAFAYENGAAKRRLMVFAVDEHAHVYWFYPAWANAADNPLAIPIEAGRARHELPEAIRHRFEGARLEIHGLFVDDPVSVRDVEARLQAHPTGEVALPGEVESLGSLRVLP